MTYVASWHTSNLQHAINSKGAHKSCFVDFEVFYSMILISQKFRRIFRKYEGEMFVCNNIPNALAFFLKKLNKLAKIKRKEKKVLPLRKITDVI